MIRYYLLTIILMPFVFSNPLAKEELATQKLIQQVEKSAVSISISYQKKLDIQTAASCGYFLDDKYHILTTHINKDTLKDITVFYQGKEFKAKLINTSKKSSLSVIQLTDPKDIEDVSFLKFSSSDTIHVGKSAFAIGILPEQLGSAVFFRKGVLNTILERNKQELIFPTQFISQPKLLGCGIFNYKGELISITTLHPSFSMPHEIQSNYKSLLNQKNNSFKEAWLGMSYIPITKDVAEALSIPENALLLTNVVLNSPAYKAGLRLGDLITHVNGKKITEKGKKASFQFKRLHESSLNSKVDFTIIRNNQEQKIAAIYKEKKQSEKLSVEDLGFKIESLTLSNRSGRYAVRAPHGVLITSIINGSPAASKSLSGSTKLSPGAVITKMENRPIITINDFKKALEYVRSNNITTILFTVQSGNYIQQVAINTKIGQASKDKGGK